MGRVAGGSFTYSTYAFCMGWTDSRCVSACEKAATQPKVSSRFVDASRADLIAVKARS